MLYLMPSVLFYDEHDCFGFMSHLSLCAGNGFEVICLVYEREGRLTNFVTRVV